MPDGIKPFAIGVDAAALDELRDRLRRTRWPEREPVDDWSQGVPLSYLQGLCGYWAEGYDWRATEARLNQIPQFTTVIEGLDIHFLHVRSPHPGAVPLIMTHGWPGSFLEFEQVLGPLTDPPAHGSSPGRPPFMIAKISHLIQCFVYAKGKSFTIMRPSIHGRTPHIPIRAICALRPPDTRRI